MRTLINYIRSLFCKHEFEYGEHYHTDYGFDGDWERRGTKVSRTCKKCGWHKSYWKY